jgi:hypothetical protein
MTSPLGATGDAVIGGASKLTQIAENLDALAADHGPLSEAVLAALEGAPPRKTTEMHPDSNNYNLMLCFVGAWEAVAGPPYHPSPKTAPVAKL